MAESNSAPAAAVSMLPPSTRPDPEAPVAAAPQEMSGARARAKHLPIAIEPAALVPARMINELLYCERLMALEWVHREFADNAFTVEGRAVHERADAGGGELPIPGAHAEERPYQVRSLWLSSEALGLTAKIDVVVGEGDDVVPIEYKRGKPPDVPEGAYLPERAQLAVHVLLLRAHGYRCEYGEIYFAAAKRRVRIIIDETLVRTVEAAVARARSLASEEGLPPPLEDSPKCNGCSLVGICLPDETNLLRRAEAETTTPLTRRLVPARDDRLPLYVTEPGARVGVDGGEIVVHGKETKTRARLRDTSHVSLFGNVQISTQALRRLAEHAIGVSFLSSGGWLWARAEGLESNNVALRIAQFRASQDAATCLRLARTFVEAKIRNCRTLLRRNHPEVGGQVLFELEQLARKSREQDAIESLLGIEGSAARVYFKAFGGMLKTGGEEFDLDGRNRRPPRDRVNALLSFTYSLLTRDVTTALRDAGLDPSIGFYHRPQFGRPSLALDVMEELRPMLADSVVVTALNTGVVAAGDFLVRPTGVSLTQAGRRALMLAYERRLEQLATHPTFGYRISMKRMLEVQARLLGRHILGEIPEYPQLRPR